MKKTLIVDLAEVQRKARVEHTRKLLVNRGERGPLSDLNTREIMAKMTAGQSFAYKHEHKTPFCVWIASRRNRLKKQFRYTRLGNNRYIIYL